MRLISLLFLLSLSTNCVRFDENDSKFSGGREKKDDRKPRLTQTHVNIQTTETAQQVASNQNAPASTSESLIFPIVPSANHTSFFIKSSDHQKISFSAQPDTQPLTLIAGLSGTVSLKTQNGMHHLSLTPHQGNKILHFELSETGAILATSDQAQVTQKQILIKSVQPITFYISSNSEIDVLCLNTASLEKSLKVVKELPNTEDCVQ